MSKDKWVLLERKHNRIADGTGWNDYPNGFTCDRCGETNIDSMFVHTHVCPDTPEHRENYPTERLERYLLGEDR